MANAGAINRYGICRADLTVFRMDSPGIDIQGQTANDIVLPGEAARCHVI